MELRNLARACTMECHLEKDRKIILGVSGGPDSLALADALASLGYPLIVAHFDHRLRPDSASDEAFVRDFAHQRGLSYDSSSAEVALFASEHGLSIEEGARQLRYQYLFGLARRNKAQAVAVGHTADDQVETVLMHILRGTGLAGLKGMPWRGILDVFDPKIPLVRPLLATWRKETEAWCHSHGLEARVDASNSNPVYARNRLRKEIIPLLERYSPQARKHIHQMVEHLQGDYLVLSRMAHEKYESCLQAKGPGYLAFDLVMLAALEPALQSWIMREAAFVLVRELRNFDAAAVERCREVIASAPAGWQGDLPGGIRIRVDGSRLLLMTWQADLPGLDRPQITPGVTGTLKCPGVVRVANGWLIKLRKVESKGALDQAQNNSDPNQAWIDAEQINLPLHVHSAAPGQRFQPLGMATGSQKVSDFWVNVRLSRAARSGWPLVFSGNEVVWLPGFRLAHPFRLRPESNKVLHLSLLKEQKDNG